MCVLLLFVGQGKEEGVGNVSVNHSSRLSKYIGNLFISPKYVR